MIGTTSSLLVSSDPRDQSLYVMKLKLLVKLVYKQKKSAF